MHILYLDHINSNHCFFQHPHTPKYLLPILLSSFVLFVIAYWAWLVLPVCAWMSGHPEDYWQTITGHIHKENDSPSHISHQIPLAPQQAEVHYEFLLHPCESSWNYWSSWMVMSYSEDSITLLFSILWVVCSFHTFSLYVLWALAERGWYRWYACPI